MLYEVHGSGEWLFLGPPLRAKPLSLTEDAQRAALRGAYVDRLKDRYRLVVLDYPPTGDAASIVAGMFTPDRVSADILTVADALGADRFAWYGYSWGGVVGLQLVAASSRLTALVCGGWPPLDAPYEDLLAWGRLQHERTGLPDWKLSLSYYPPLVTASEREVLSRIRCPRLVFAGADDVVESDGYGFRVGPLVAEHRRELEDMGWTVGLVPGERHDLFLRIDVVVDVLRQFLDPLLVPGTT